MKHKTSFWIVAGGLALAGCSTPETDIPASMAVLPVTESSLRTSERVRELWIAPRVVQPDVLLHEERVTFVEDPPQWNMAAVVEAALNQPKNLPLPPGTYDAEPLRREKTRYLETQKTVENLQKEIERLNAIQAGTATEHADQLEQARVTLDRLQAELGKTSRKLTELQAAERKREALQHQNPPKPWWKWW